MAKRMTSGLKLAQLERRIAKLERHAGSGAERKATIGEVRRAFVQRVNRDGVIDYLEFWRETRYPWALVEQVVRELEERRLIEDADSVPR